jgi:hypothetical protein
MLHSIDDNGSRLGAVLSREFSCGVVASPGIMGGYRALPEPLAVISQMANAAKLSRAMTCGRLYSCDTLLERLA